MNTLGYCCINTELRNRKPARLSVYCSRGMPKRTFNLPEASRRALANARDLLTILEWNNVHDIKCFRISSDLFPRMTCSDHGYKFTDLPDHEAISLQLKRCGDYARSHGMLLSFHPGPFTTIASPNESARLNGIAEVEMHAMACNLIDPDNCMDIPINYHVGGSYGGEFTSTAERFCRSFEQLSDRARSSTVIENDDKPNCWSVALLIEHIHYSCGVPITFDYHHHMIHSGGLSAQDAFDLARCTWGNRNMQCHYSQSPTDDKLIPAHSDYYRDPMPDFMAFAENCHIHLECKMKEQALIKYRDQFGVKS